MENRISTYKRIVFKLVATLFSMSLIFSCNTTKDIPEGDQLFTGLMKIAYKNYVKNDNFYTTQEEVNAALATAPNGALFGSSYYRTPFPYGLWIWNAFVGKEDTFSKWMLKSFGKQPVLMSWVNPALRASVAQSVLRNHGYFHGVVNYETVKQGNPKKIKIGYAVNMGHLFTIDTIHYVGFPETTDSIMNATRNEALVRTNDAFTVASLDAERVRLSTLFRNNGYYYYQSNYTSYLADTVSVPGKVQLRLQAVNDIPKKATRKWYIGNVSIDLKQSFADQLNDSIQHRWLKVCFSGKKPALRTRVIMAAMKLRHGQLYGYDKYEDTYSKLNTMGLFSMIDFNFTPRDSIQECDTLDLKLNCTLDKPYDFYTETDFVNRTIGRMGPELKIGLTKRNAFHGGEKLDINLHGSYEWQTSGNTSRSSYDYGMDASLEFPRIVAPFFGGNRTTKNVRKPRKRFYSPPYTLAKVSTDVLYRPSYYKMHVVTGEWTYKWQSSTTSRHEFSPFTLKYQYMNSRTVAFDSIVNEHPYLSVIMHDVFIPQMRYTYTYQSLPNKLNPIRWETSISEAGNILSVGMVATGKKWTTQNKELFKNPYSQFVKIETDFTKTWTLSNSSKLVAHLAGGIIRSFGNSSKAPYSELFTIGGANSVRAFPVHSLGPGTFYTNDNQFSYLVQNGEIKLLGNLEYRKLLFSNLYGAVFLDAGNVWDFKHSNDMTDEETDGMSFRFNDFLRQIAVGTGFGFRYNLDFLVLRLDWGVGLHVPYETSKSGFYNITHFKDCQTLNFAIGYPF